MKDFAVYVGLVGKVASVAVYAVELFRSVLDKKAPSGSISAQTTLHDLGWERASVWVGFPGKYGQVSVCRLVRAKYGTESCDESPLTGISRGLGNSSQPVAHPNSCPFSLRRVLESCSLGQRQPHRLILPSFRFLS